MGRHSNDDKPPAGAEPPTGAEPPAAVPDGAEPGTEPPAAVPTGAEPPPGLERPGSPWILPGSPVGRARPVEAATELIAVTVAEAEPGRPPGRRRSLLLVATVGTLALALVALIVALIVNPGTGGSDDPYSALDNGPTGPSPVDDPSVSGVGASGRPVHPSGSTTAGPLGPAGAGGPSGSPTAAGSPTPTATAVASQAPPSGVAARYSVQQSWPGGFIAQIQLTNSATAARSWQITLEYPSTVTRYVTGWSNGSNPPSTTTSGQRATVTGPSPLGPGQSVTVFLQYDDQSDKITPTACAVNGGACTLA